MNTSHKALAIAIDILCQSDPALAERLKDFDQEDNDYQACAELETALNAMGYTIDWGLDAEPFNLRPIQAKE